MTTNQEGRHSSFRTIGSGSSEYNGDAIAAFIAEGATGSTFSDLFVSWLQIRTSSSATNVSDLMALFASQQGFNRWDEINTIPALATDKLLLETGDALLLETGDNLLLE